MMSTTAVVTRFHEIHDGSKKTAEDEDEIKVNEDVNGNGNSLQPLLPLTEIHYLPFKIEYDGQVENVDGFCTKKVEEKDSSKVSNYFRGRSIQGDSITLKDYVGIFMVEQAPAKAPSTLLKTDSPYSDDNLNKDKSLNISSRFNKFTYWNWDRVPTQMDSPVKLMDWLELSQILHEPSQMESSSEEATKPS